LKRKDEEMKGTIKSVNQKGFGFVKSGEGEYFFHRSDFNGFWNDLMEDKSKHKIIEVEFDVVESNRGPRANNVKRTDE